MEIRLQEFTKLKLPLLLLLVLFLGCDKDEVINTEIPQSQKVYEITLNDFNSRVNYDSTYQSISSYFDVNRTSTKTASELSANSNVVILTDEITVVELEHNLSYTFKVLTETEGNIFYNLVVETDFENNILSSVFYEYTPSDEWLLDSEQPFTGYVDIVNNDIFNVDDLFASKRFGRCVDNAELQQICTGGWEDVPNPPGIECQGWSTVLVISYVPCTGGGIGNTPPDSGVPVTGGNIGPGGEGTNGTGTVPNRTCRNQSIGFDGGDGCSMSISDVELSNVFGQDNFKTDSNINSSDVPQEFHFNTQEELQNFYDSLTLNSTNIESETLTFPNDPNKVIEKCTFPDWFFDFNVYIEQTLGDDYNVDNITSNISGMTVFVAYEQLNWTTTSVNPAANVSNVDINSEAEVTLIYKGVGRIVTFDINFNIWLNINDGSENNGSITID